MWYFKNEQFTPEMVTDKMFGFVYVITELSSGKKYIGQKQFWSKKPKVTNGKKKMIKCSSDWVDYMSSSEYLKVLDPSLVTKEILYITMSKGQSNYVETMLQMDFRVLEKPDVWLNKIMNFRCHHTHVKFDKIIDKDLHKLQDLYAEEFNTSY